MTRNQQLVLEDFIEAYAIKILEGKASLFVGSGFSRGANLPVWADLLENFASEIKLDVRKEKHNLISLAQYYVNAKKRTKLNEVLKQRFSYSSLNSSLTLPNHDLLAALPIKNIWTTNYDQLLEKTFEQHNIFPICLTDDKTICEINNKNGVLIHKIHGDADTPEDCVITKADYDLYSDTHEMLLAKLKAEMCYNTFLFLGYSFNDTNIQHILSRIRAIFGNKEKYGHNMMSPNKHYCIFARNKKKPNDSSYNYKYENQRQKHHIDDLKSYGIHTILLDDHTQITDVLKKIRNRVCKKNIFISGAYPDEIPNDERQIINSCATSIAAGLVADNYNIYSGYGQNLGSDIVHGAHDGCELSNVHGQPKELKWLNNHLFIFPFPYKKIFLSDSERTQRFEKWRKNIIEKTQITIIISGMKINESQNLVYADGVYREYMISRDQDNLIIPIEFTGGMAKRIWDEMLTNQISYATTPLFQKLKEQDGILDTIYEIIETYALNN